MDPETQRALADLALSQDGLLTRNQALACGLGRSSYRHRIQPGGPWRRVLPGVAATFTGTPTMRQRRRAALLHAGDGGLLSCLDALDLHGVPLPRALRSNQVHVLIGHERSASPSGLVVVHRTIRMPVNIKRDGLDAVPVARAVIDACREMRSSRDVRALIADVVQQGRVTVEQLVEELRLGPSAGSRYTRAALDEVAAGVRSVAEADFRQLVLSGGLPEPHWNCNIGLPDGTWLARPDGFWEDANTVFEVDSHAYHLSPEAAEETQARHFSMTSLGLLVVHAAPTVISNQGPLVLANLVRTLERGRTLPRAGVIRLEPR